METRLTSRLQIEANIHDGLQRFIIWADQLVWSRRLCPMMLLLRLRLT